MNLSFPSRKLKGCIKRVNLKVSKLDINPENFTVFGVSKKEGVSVTGKEIGKDLSTYYYFKGQKFAYNPYRINVGSIGLSDENFEGLMSSAYVIFETTKDINDEFLLLYLKSPLGINLIKWYGDRGGVRSALRFKDLEKIDFPNLTYQEQTNALEIIKIKQSIVDRLNIQLKYQKKLIVKLRQSILQDAVQGKLTAGWREKNQDIEPASELLKRIQKEKEQLIKEKKFKKEKPLTTITTDEIPYELPNSWEWCRLGDFDCVFQNGISKRSGDGEPCVVLRLADIKNGKIDQSDTRKINLTSKERNKYNLLKNDILITRVNGSAEIVGTFTPVEEKLDFTYCDHFIRLRFMLSDSINSEFLCVISKSNLLRNQIENLFITTAGQKTINQGHVLSLLISFPSWEEQNVIVSKVNELMAYCDQLEKQVLESKFQAEQLMQALLQEVFNPEKKENSDDVVKELFPELETIADVANLQQAMIFQKTELGLGSGRGKVYAQKTSANLKNIFGVDIPYIFEKSHHGEFSYQLSEDLDRNPYLCKVKTEFGEIYQVKNNKQQEVLNALNKPENASFIQSIDELLKVYQNDLIKGSTDRIELLNTVWRAIKDTKSLIGNIVYKYLEEWEIQQGAYKTKADKFTKSETFAMITLIKDLGWHKKLIQ